MSKKVFESPKLEIIILQTEDILTTSTNSFDGVWVPLDNNNDDNDLLIQ